MTKRNEVRIRRREIKLEVVIPAPEAYDFMAEFGKAFETVDSHGTAHLRAVERYSQRADGWRIIVSVHENEENDLYNFIVRFCQGREISFRDPRME